MSIAFGGILVLLPVCFLGQHRSSKRDQLGEQTLLRVDLIEKGGQKEHALGYKGVFHAQLN